MTKHTDAYMERLRALQLEQAEAHGSLHASVSIILHAYNFADGGPTDTDWRFLQEGYDRVSETHAAIQIHLTVDPSTYEAA